ncbi:MAG: signal peptidase II [Salinisphaeraceae bacterium]|nr:signal peptidase II [Salinisphaeraceae bacterium]
MAIEYKNVYWLWLSMVVIVLDQITKQLVVNNLDHYQVIELLPFFNLVRMHNTGAAFSMFSDASPLLFIGLGIAVSIGVLIWLRRNPQGERLMAVALVLVLGGALGNVIDRATRGYVVDFLDFHAAGWHWPSFNVADIAIVTGAGLLILDMILQSRRERDD